MSRPRSPVLGRVVGFSTKGSAHKFTAAERRRISEHIKVRQRRHGTVLEPMPEALRWYAERGLLDREWSRPPLDDVVPREPLWHAAWSIPERSSEMVPRSTTRGRPGDADAPDDDIFAQLLTKIDQSE